MKQPLVKGPLDRIYATCTILFFQNLRKNRLSGPISSKILSDNLFQNRKTSSDLEPKIIVCILQIMNILWQNEKQFLKLSSYYPKITVFSTSLGDKLWWITIFCANKSENHRIIALIRYHWSDIMHKQKAVSAMFLLIFTRNCARIFPDMNP